ncbi:MAG: AmmeMemoRadiSam system protein B [Patescibacteria group bacterium]|nr:AmmeMemoRadiSam system protein B [Patescibacteria group bacterium]
MNKLSNNIIIIIGLSCCLVLLFCFWFIKPLKLSPPPADKQNILSLPIVEIQDSFYNGEQFLSAIRKADKITPRSDVYAMIVPHHLVGADIIAELIKTASGRPIDTVIVIGPNHNNIGREPLATAPVNWQTPEGILPANVKLEELFLGDNRLQPNQSALEKEHSVGAIMPFIKHYWPQAQVLPIVLSSYAGKVEAEKLSDWLKSRLGKNSLVIFSFDFSHYLTKGEADLKDKETKNLIENFLIDKIYGLNNDHVDSPAGLAAAMLLAQKVGLKIFFVRHNNSFDYAISKPVATTSYFGIAFISQ